MKLTDRLKSFRLWGLFILTLAVAACAGTGTSGKRQTNADLQIVSFGSIHGEIAPCGWKSGRKGGLARRAGYIDSLHAAHTPVVHVDLGNFASTEALVDSELTRFIWDRMVEIGVDATTPGPRELQNWGLYRELMAGGDLAVVSSNLTVVENGQSKPLGQPYVIVERSGVKAALFGLMGGSQFTGARIPDGVEIQYADPIEAARALVPELQSKADVVVLLSQMSTPDTDRLVQEVPGIDVALYGNLPPWNEDPSKVADTITQRTGTRGQYLGHLILILDPDGNIIDFGAKNIQMNESMPEQPALAEKVSAEEEAVKKVRDEHRQAGQTHGPEGTAE